MPTHLGVVLKAPIFQRLEHFQRLGSLFDGDVEIECSWVISMTEDACFIQVIFLPGAGPLSKVLRKRMIVRILFCESYT